MNIDLSKLFRWNTSLVIKDLSDNDLETCYIRLVGDLDYADAQQYGLLASRKLRKKLNDKDSVQHQALFLDLEEKTNEELVLGILLAETNNFRDQAMNELGDDIFKYELPDDAELEDKEKKQEAEEKFAKDRVENLRNKMEELSLARKEELEKLSVEKLRELFISTSINYRCVEEFTGVFREYCVYAGCYKDAKFNKRLFSSFEEFRNISTHLKRQLVDAYIRLELTGDQLKN